MKVDKKLCEHLNWVRLRQGGELLPAIAINMFWSRLELPSKKEGIKEIIEIPFLPKKNS